MLASHSVTLTSASPKHTCQIAQTLAKRLAAGDILLFSGDVGAGKTHFARCIIQDLLLHFEDVPSPTYTLVQTYASRSGEIWHADLYRLTDSSEIEELGLTQAFESAITLIEWPDRLGDDTPKQALHLSLGSGEDEDSRVINFSWTDIRWEQKLKDLIDD